MTTPTMTAYIWENVSPVSTAYHDTGSILIIAADLDAARAAWAEYAATPNSRGSAYLDDATAIDSEPDVTYGLAGTPEPRVIVFPDAGCC